MFKLSILAVEPCSWPVKKKIKKITRWCRKRSRHPHV